LTHSLATRLEHAFGRERTPAPLALGGIRELLAALGDPHRRLDAVHVAGTNGKGTVCALVERVLREAGCRTGLYTSPHLVDFRERIRVNGRWADAAWIERACARIEGLPAGRGRTFFEVATALAFAWFAEQGVEIAVVEVGLGGGDDATNVIHPRVAVIASVDLDHVEALGKDLAAIAAAKAGIVKPGVPVVENVEWPEARATIHAAAAARGAEVIPAGSRTQSTGDLNVMTFATRSFGTLALEVRGLAPLHVLNLPTVVATLDTLAQGGLAIPEAAVRAGIARARWPGRLEPCPSDPRLWWDGAHNPAGARALVRAWRATGRDDPAVLVLALGADKDAAGVLETLDRGFPRARWIATRSADPGALAPERLAAIARPGGGAPAAIVPDVADACRRALATATEAHPALLVGSLHAVGEAMEAFGGAPEAVT
jgi:dihydrofolate synthase/folylpolyglutamate synthase